MLFVLNEQGVPSVAKFIRLKLGRAPTPPADTTPPETAIVSGPPPATTSDSAEFEFSSSEAGSSFECLLDDGDWAGCTSPATRTGLSPGPHTFEVRATDPAGNTDETPAKWSSTVVVADPGDTTDPETLDRLRPGVVFRSDFGEVRVLLQRVRFGLCLPPRLR